MKYALRFLFSGALLWKSDVEHDTGSTPFVNWGILLVGERVWVWVETSFYFGAPLLGESDLKHVFCPSPCAGLCFGKVT